MLCGEAEGGNEDARGTEVVVGNFFRNTARLDDRLVDKVEYETEDTCSDDAESGHNTRHEVAPDEGESLLNAGVPDLVSGGRDMEGIRTVHAAPNPKSSIAAATNHRMASTSWIVLS